MTNSDTPAAVSRLAAALSERGQTLAVAEGATGGALAHLLTQAPGSSAWFRAGIIAYTDYAKQLLLRVSTESIEERGSISPEATVQMARLARRLFNADWAIGITGFADGTAPAPSARAPGVPPTNAAGVSIIPAEHRAPEPGLTFIAISGRAAGPQGDSQTWEEHTLAAPDRATYQRNAAIAAIELLLQTLEG